MSVSIRLIDVGDAAEVAGIYNHYVVNTCITFETEPVAVQDMAGRVQKTLDTRLPWLVAEASGQVIGFAYASKWQGRCAYRFSVESTVYLAAAHAGRGLGLRLYKALVDAVRATSMHSMIGGIALPNEPSVRLHERLGFRKIGQFEQVGYKFDRWVDVGYCQLLL